MAIIMSVEQICERVLRKIGSWAITSSGPREREITETRYWLDMVIGHEASRQRTWWLIGSAATFPLQIGVDSYDLTTVLGAQAPDGIQFPVMAVLYNPVTGVDVHELPLVRGQEWERRNLGPDVVENGAEPNNLLWLPEPPMGTSPAIPTVPMFVYIDRAQKPTLRCYPAPAAITEDPTQTYSIRIQFQSFAPDMVKGQSLEKIAKLRSSMNLWIVTAVAAQVANGPVRKAPADEVQDMQKEAQRLRDDLEAYDWQEQAGEPRRVSFYNGI